MADSPVRVDEQVLRAHLEAGPFQSGLDRGRWRLLFLNWPYALIAVKAAERDRGPEEYILRFECSNYPMAPPTAQLWDTATNTPLSSACWPSGKRRVSAVFNPKWKNGQCLYLPCDRLSIEGHDGWRTQYPEMIWSPEGDITQYLRIIYDLLISSDYSGPCGT